MKRLEAHEENIVLLRKRLVEKVRGYYFWTIFVLFNILFASALLYIIISGKKHVYLYILFIFYLFFLALTLQDIMLKNTSVTGYRMSPLSKLGLTLEHRKDYHGYKGIYRNYFLRIFPQGFTGPWLDSYSFYIILYYRASEIGKAPETKAHLIKRYVWWRKFVRFFFIIPELKVEDISIIRSENFDWIFSFRHIKKKIDYMINLAEQEGLVPLTELEVDALIAANPDNAPGGYADDFAK